MLPTRLEMRNFLAYRTPDPINFEDLHLACLSGRNGAGKSSLLDAITWVLWGKARARSDDDLIHLGQDEMQVSLEFLQGDQHYRVVRKRKPGRRRQSGGQTAGQSSLELFVRDNETQVYRVISEPSMRETQVRINALLRLDYEIFVHSAFLQQGKADVFTTKTPAQRKEILSEILGLERWTQYEDESKKRLNQIQNEMVMLASRITEMETEIAEEPALERELEEAETQREAAYEQVRIAEVRLDEVRGADIELRSMEESLAGVESSIRQREDDMDAVKSEITRQERRIAAFRALIAQEGSIQSGYAQLQEARAADRELGDKLRELNDINQHIASLEQKLAEVRQELELEVRQLETRI